MRIEWRGTWYWTERADVEAYRIANGLHPADFSIDHYGMGYVLRMPCGVCLGPR